MYDNHMLHYKKALSTAKSSYGANLIRLGEGNTRALFSSVNNILTPLDNLASHLYSTGQLMPKLKILPAINLSEQYYT